MNLEVLTRVMDFLARADELRRAADGVDRKDMRDDLLKLAEQYKKMAEKYGARA